MIFRTQGREDIFSFLFSAENQEQTGNHNQGNDTFGFQIYLCRTYATYRNKVCSMHYYREDILNAVILKEIRDVLIKYRTM